jgi:hypothetical protein
MQDLTKPVDWEQIEKEYMMGDYFFCKDCMEPVKVTKGG